MHGHLRRPRPARWAVGLGSLALSLTLSAGCYTEPDAQPRADQLQNATAFARLAVAGDFDGGLALLTQDLRRTLAPQALADMWREAGGPAAGTGRIEAYRGAVSGEFQVIYIRVLSAGPDLDVRVVFRDKPQIGGVWFRPSAPEKTYRPLSSLP